MKIISLYRNLFLFLLLAFVLIGCGQVNHPDRNQHLRVSEASFDTLIQEQQVQLLTLQNETGMTASITNYGARIVQLSVPDRTGKPIDVVLGFDRLSNYIHAAGPYYGAVVGRYAGRIAEGEFKLAGKTFPLTKNSEGLTLHGGKAGFHQQVWQVKEADNRHVRLSYLSHAGEEGFPGNLRVTVEYRLTDDNKLAIQYSADTDEPTVLNLTNHSFFNLNGEGDSSVFNHVLMIHAASYWPLTGEKLPDKQAKNVQTTPFDFNRPATIGSRLTVQDSQLRLAGGFDHTYILNPERQWEKDAVANVYSPRTGIQMEVFTQQPGMQLFTANFLDGKDRGKSGKVYVRYGAFCLETQHFPNSPNREDFPTTTLNPGETFESTTIYGFSVK